MYKIGDIVQLLEKLAPLSYQESYDNAGLITGSKHTEATGALLCLDATEAVLDEAIAKNINLVIAHHPIIFSGLKKITGKNYVERTIIKAIKHDIAIYASHTNLDNVQGGVNSRICEKLNLQNTQVLSPKTNDLLKLVCFTPVDHAESIRKALFDAGCGHIGNYDCASFNLYGEGTFRAKKQASPFVGKVGEIHTEKEVRTEVLLPLHLQSNVIHALITAHPYEEPAYDIYPVTNPNRAVGIGMLGELSEAVETSTFLHSLKKVFNIPVIRHTKLTKSVIRKVAVCGGSGSFLLPQARAENADIFISGDFKYHEFFDAEDQLIIADIGHYESEQFSMNIFYDLLIEKLSNFAVHFTSVNTNPINYF